MNSGYTVPAHAGLSLGTFLFGSETKRTELRLEKFVRQVNSRESWAAHFSDDYFPVLTQWLKSCIAAGDQLDTIRINAFALVREAARRILGERPFDVQIMGAYALDSGCVAEMKTGEGKTLVCTLPAYFNSLRMKGVHIVTVNEYLAKRDAAWMKPLYDFLGVSSGVIYAGMDREERRKAYECDITYGTNSEFAFDYLRDNMQYASDKKVQRGFAYAVIDEADSILIDEARTPLIISGEGNDDSALWAAAAKTAARLSETAKKNGTDEYPDEIFGEKVTGDYKLDRKARKVSLTSFGMNHIEELLHADGCITGSITSPENFGMVHYIIQSLAALHLYSKDTEYVVKDGKIQIVDEFTGRILLNRRYSDGLHEAIEMKEHLSVKRRTCTSAEISFQNYFRMYDKLCGMTGTAATESEEFEAIYSMPVVIIPSNRPVVREDELNAVFSTAAEKWQAVAEEICRAHEQGQPVLAGTASVENSELLSRMLTAKGIPHQVLNAKNDEKEAHIIAQAGIKGAVTIATNMAGRGTDIKLGGCPEAYPGAYTEVKNLGGLYVIGTECYESRRIDNQLRGRAGRQGDPGKSRFFISLEDPLIRLYGNNRKFTSAAAVQESIEKRHFRMRRDMLDYDDVLSEQRMFLYACRDRILWSSCPEKTMQYFSLPETQEEETVLSPAEKDREKMIRTICLHIIDTAWESHLEDLENLHEAVYLRTYAQKKPLVEYQSDASLLFSDMLKNIQAEADQILKKESAA